MPNRNYSCTPSQDRCFIKLPPGSGGGCVSGPLANWTVSLGPIQTKAEGIKPNPQADGLGYNPRCLNRDLNKVSAYASRDEVITELITTSNEVGTFQNRLQGDFENGYLGVHSAGHYTVGGDAGSDFFNAPSDPVCPSLSLSLPFLIVAFPCISFFSTDTRPVLLLPPRHGRPHMVDLAEPRCRCAPRPSRRHNHVFGSAAQPQWHAAGYTDAWTHAAGRV